MVVVVVVVVERGGAGCCRSIHAYNARLINTGTLSSLFVAIVAGITQLDTLCYGHTFIDIVVIVVQAALAYKVDQ